MWSLDDCRYLFVFIGLTSVILFTVPSALMVVHVPNGESFSELYLLGSGHMAEGYPFNVNSSNEYSVYLGVRNHMGYSASYEVDLKLLNSSDVAPNDTSGAPNPSPALYEYRMFLMDGQTLEETLNFSFQNVNVPPPSNGSISSIETMNINSIPLEVNKTATWDSGNSGYYYRVVAELYIWKYNATSSAFVFDSRFVSLWLSMTSNA